MSIPTTQLPPTNFLVDLIPVAKRKQVYALFGLVGFLLFVVTVTLAAITQDLPPTWLIILTVAHNASTPFFSALATANAVPVGEEAQAIVAGEPGNIEDPSLGEPGNPDDELLDGGSEMGDEIEPVDMDEAEEEVDTK